MKNKKGITVIELLTIISVVFFLGSFIISDISDSRTQSQNTSVQKTLVLIKTQVELYYLSSVASGSYSGFCYNTETLDLLSSMEEANSEKANCVDSVDSYTISIGKKGTGSKESYCMDSSEFFGNTLIYSDAQTTPGTCKSIEIKE